MLPRARTLGELIRGKFCWRRWAGTRRRPGRGPQVRREGGKGRKKEGKAEGEGRQVGGILDCRAVLKEVWPASWGLGDRCISRVTHGDLCLHTAVGVSSRLHMGDDGSSDGVSLPCTILLALSSNLANQRSFAISRNKLCLVTLANSVTHQE